MGYCRRSFVLPAEVEDDFVAELWAAGTLGVVVTPGQDGRVHLEAYFPAGDGSGMELGGWMERGVEEGGKEAVPERDWLARWREEARPFLVGRKFVLDPREPGEEPEAEVPEGRRLLRLPARSAFGTGSHESTRLALELLEETDVARRRVLDVGTGTGILSFAALSLGAAEAVAYDLDVASPVHARDNARLNGFAGSPLPKPSRAGATQTRASSSPGVGPGGDSRAVAAHLGLFAGRIAALREGPFFDLVLVNALPEEVLPDFPHLVRLLKPGAEVILSGVLTERASDVLSHLAALGLVERARREAGEWLGFRLTFT